MTRYFGAFEAKQLHIFDSSYAILVPKGYETFFNLEAKIGELYYHRSNHAWYDVEENGLFYWLIARKKSPKNIINIDL